MNSQNILHELNELVKKQFPEVDFDVNLQTKLTGEKENSLDLSSLDIVTLIVNIEERFDIIIDFDKVYVTMEDIVNDVEKKLNEK